MDDWQISLHESAHAVVAMSLGVRVSAVGLIAGGGYAARRPTDTLRAAIIAGAGSAGESLAEQYPAAPLLTIDVPEPFTAQHLKAGAVVAGDVYNPDDADLTAKWITAAPENEWADREWCLNLYIDKLVSKHASLIAGLASFLYRRRVLGREVLEHFESVISQKQETAA